MSHTDTPNIDHGVDRSNCFITRGREACEIELQIMAWFAAGHEILWIPIYEISAEPDGIWLIGG